MNEYTHFKPNVAASENRVRKISNEIFRRINDIVSDGYTKGWIHIGWKCAPEEIDKVLKCIEENSNVRILQHTTNNKIDNLHEILTLEVEIYDIDTKSKMELI